MLRILERRWRELKPKHVLRQFAGWATGLLDDYRYNIYTRTKWNVVLLQVLYVVTILALFWFTLNAAHRKLVDTLLVNIGNVLANPDLELADQVPLLIEQSKLESVTILFLCLVGVAAAFGFVVAHLTLRPTRLSLDMQKKFIGNVAHELRTPLSVLKTNTEVALLTEDPSEGMRGVLEQNIQEIDRIASILNNLLSFNSLYLPDRMIFDSVDLVSVVERSIELLRPLAAERVVELMLTGIRGLCVHGNEVALEQLVVNIIKNAIVYSPRGEHKRVHISIAPDDAGYIDLVVLDKGIGMNKDELFRIQEPFYRVDKSRARAEGSSGLGLTIVTEIVKLHKAKLHIQSTVGKGTRILVKFPAALTSLSLGRTIQDTKEA